MIVSKVYKELICIKFTCNKTVRADKGAIIILIYRWSDMY